MATFLKYYFLESQQEAQVKCKDVKFKMTPLHLAALNGNDNILDMIGKNNLNSRDYRSRKADQLLGRLFPPITVIQPMRKVLRISKRYEIDYVFHSQYRSFDHSKSILIGEFLMGNFISF